MQLKHALQRSTSSQPVQAQEAVSRQGGEALLSQGSATYIALFRNDIPHATGRARRLARLLIWNDYPNRLLRRSEL